MESVCVDFMGSSNPMRPTGLCEAGLFDLGGSIYTSRVRLGSLVRGLLVLAGFVVLALGPSRWDYISFLGQLSQAGGLG